MKKPSLHNDLSFPLSLRGSECRNNLVDIGITFRRMFCTIGSQRRKVRISLIVGLLLLVFSACVKRQSGGTSDQTNASSTGGQMIVIETTHGNIEIDLYPGDAPKTVIRISELARQGFYDGLTFHRVVPGFVVQGGDPKGNGTGGSGKNLVAEFNSRQHVEGTVAMARASDPNSADSQFYISLGRLVDLDGKYTVFGQVTKGMDAVKKIKVGDKMNKVSVKP